MRRWLALSLGLAIAAVALYVLASGRGDPPMAEIDSASRADLQRVLEATDGRRTSR